ncbi:MAG: prepilin peptidase, partial [Myxococcota bacterium]
MIDPDPIVSVVGQGFAVVYGLVIGSFLAVCIQRLPEDRSLRVPSACERCGAKLGWTENIPLVSYLALRGRCRHCGSRIPPLHPLVEALGGLLGWLVYRRVIADPADLDAAHAAAWVVRFGFLALLVVAAYVDVRHRIIPDQTSIYAVPFGIAAAVVLGWLGYDGFGTVTWQLAVLGAAGWG